MIYGIGTDIVRVDRMRRNLDRFGPRFARRILADQEFADFGQSTRPAYFLAKRFAAKEAFVKALGTGFSQGVGLSDVRVAHEPQGRPYLEFSAGLAALLREWGVGAAHLSLSDEDDYAVAFVVLLRQAPGGSGES